MSNSFVFIFILYYQGMYEGSSFPLPCQHFVFDYSHSFCIEVECDLTCFFNRGKFLEMCDDLLARVEPPLRSVLEQASKYFHDLCISY
jgi:hypothetical protein